MQLHLPVRPFKRQEWHLCRGFLLLECLVAILLATALGFVLIYYAALISGWNIYSSKTLSMMHHMRQFVASLHAGRQKALYFEKKEKWGVLTYQRIPGKVIAAGPFEIKTQLPHFWIVELNGRSSSLKNQINLSFSTGICT